MITERHDFKMRYMGDEILNTPTKEIEEVHAGIVEICNKMVDIMYFMRGFGLAANQVGVPYRIFVMDTKYSMDKKRRPINKKPIVMINPVVKEVSEETVTSKEGCLSIPGQEVVVARAKSVTVEYTDIEGERRTAVCEDTEARCVLHEIDHLDGKLMLDHVDEKTRNFVKINHLQARKRLR